MSVQEVQTLAARAVQLDRQVAFLRELVKKHHEVLYAVDDVLGENPQLRDLRRRVQALSKQQHAVIAHQYFDPDALQSHYDPLEDARSRGLTRPVTLVSRPEESGSECGDPVMCAPSAPPAIAASTVAATAKEAATRIQGLTVKLLNMWYDHIAAKLGIMLRQPLDLFEEFHNAPTEDSLSNFMNGFRTVIEEVDEMLPSGDRAKSSAAQREALGPKGNPFESDERLLQLYARAIQDSITDMLSDAEVGTPAVSAPAAPPARKQPTAPPSSVEAAGVIPASVKAPPPAKAAPPAAVPQRSPAGVRTASAPRPFVEEPRGRIGTGQHTGMDTPVYSAFAERATEHPQQVSHVPPLHPGRLSLKSEVTTKPNQVTPLHSDRLSRPPTPSSNDAVATPGRARSAQDSSQVQSMLSWDPHARSSAAAAVGRAPVVQTRIQQLQQQLHMLESQLTTGGSGRMDSGSEAKYYALSKKLQRIRAEILKEQREDAELSQVQREVAQQRATRQEDFRQFHR